MKQEQFRTFLAVLLVVIVGFGMYVGWYFMHHQADPCRGKVGYEYVQCRQINH